MFSLISYVNAFTDGEEEKTEVNGGGRPGNDNIGKEAVP